MKKRPVIFIFLGFFLGIFYTNCTPNQLILKEQFQIEEQPPQTSQAEPPPQMVPPVVEEDDADPIGVVASYNFNEGSGTISEDSSGNNYHGTITGATWTAGKSGSALSFNGTSNYVSLPNVLTTFSEFTASAWIKVSNLTARPGILTTGGYNGTGFRVWISAEGSVCLLIAGNNSYDRLSTATGIIITGAFYHISVAGKSGQYMRIYVNGVLVKEKITTQTVGAPTTNGYIGSAWNSSSELMNGIIDDVRIYNRVLGSNEIYRLSGGASDSVAPAGAITINSNATSTNVAKVTLNLSATDAITGVAGFYLSENSTAPTEGQRGWVRVAASTAYSLDTPFTLSSGAGNKTVYVWYKDLAGNISPVYSASITDNAPTAGPDWSAWKNIFNIAWRGASSIVGLNDRIRYAKQMGYDGIAIGAGERISLVKNASNKNNLKFYLKDPIFVNTLFSGNVPTGYSIHTTRPYTQAERDWYNLNMVWKSNDPFPNNLAPSFFFDATSFSVVWDFQQQRVIDLVVEKIVQTAQDMEDKSIGFTFGGHIYDMAQLRGTFARWDGSSTIGVYLRTLTGTGIDSGLIHSGITHEYASYSDGFAAFFKKLNSRFNEVFGVGVTKWISEPGYIYSEEDANAGVDEWVWTAEQRSDYGELGIDLYIVERGSLTSFLNPNIFNSIIPIKKDMVGSAVYRTVNDSDRIPLAGNIGVNGSWYHWSAMYEYKGLPHDFQSIVEVWPRLKLIRVIPNWDNLNNVSLSERSWDGSVYRSTKSYISNDVMYSRQPKTGKLFAVFNTTSGVIKLDSGETVNSMKNIDDYFIESTDASPDFDIVGTEIRLKSTVAIDKDSSTNQIKGKGYIFTLAK